MSERIFHNAKRICREILVRLVQGHLAGNLAEKIDRVPLDMRPSQDPVTRCCIYKDRAVIKYRCMASLGMAVETETDELTSLSEYYQRATAGEFSSGEYMTVLQVACSSCASSGYSVSNGCRGCVARPCVSVCPKNAVAVIKGQAHIDQDLCIKCGKCLEACPFHAIVWMPVPCEESCPVKAVYQDEHGRRIIDKNKCIYCGKCIAACPFGAIMECSRLLDVINAIKSGRHVTALPAPAIEGQFPANWQQMEIALKKLGFSDVLQVAWGAEMTIAHEAEELAEKLDSGQTLMTTSCCPAFVQFARKHSPAIEPFISHTPSPMIYAGKLAKQKVPDTLTVFIGPCLAKRVEAQASEYIDFVVSFEELGAWLVAAEIFPDELEPEFESKMPSGPARGFALSGGVADAVSHCYNGNTPLKKFCIDGIDRKATAILKNPHKAIKDNFLEVMACKGGCVGGPTALQSVQKAASQVKKAIGDS